MGTIIGFAIGYLLGLSDGEEGFARELKQAWRTVSSSQAWERLLNLCRLLLPGPLILLIQIIIEQTILRVSQWNKRHL
jgi:hypothetical protein